MRTFLSLLVIFTLAMAAPAVLKSQTTDRQSGGTFIIVKAPGDVPITVPETGSLMEFHSAGTRMLDIDKKVGEEACFTLTAKDKNGNVIRSWNTSGNATTLTLKNSQANTDSSTQSWNADPEGYTWAKIMFNGVELTTISANEWSIPASMFDDNAQARICLVDTRAETGVYIEVTPTFAGLNQVTDKINFSAGGISNYLVELTSSTAKGNQVFHMRAYEIIVSPRDRYLNVSTETISTKFSARWPGEFDANRPGLADIFSGEVFITGPTNYILASRLVRELPAEQPQWVMAYSTANNTVSGRTNDYEILSHAPVPFNLLTPPDHYIMAYEHSWTTLDFTWQKPNPPDPYTNIKVSQFPLRFDSDTVTYTWTIVDSVSLTRAENIASNSMGTLPLLTLSHAQMADVIRRMSGQQTVKSYNCVWYVNATDGLYNTLSSPPLNDPSNRPGYHIFIDLGTTSAPSPAAPAVLQLKQNFPNPFNPSTSITFSIPKTGKTLVTVYDLIGAPVATLVNEQLEAGEYTVNFAASHLPSGIYIYKLQHEGRTITKRMTLMK
jgi:hypothetical protein